MTTLKNIRVSRARLSEQVATQLKALMVTHDLKPGDRLPSEHNLAETLGISRSILREAIKLLEQQGLLSVQVGRGTFVAQVVPEDVSDAMADSLSIMMQQTGAATPFEQFYEIRQMLEIEIAGIAALRATPNDVQRLENALARMKQYHQTDVEQFVLADTDYHQYLARATQNPLFITLLMSITKLLHQIQLQASGILGGPQAAIEFHKQILEAVRTASPEASRQAMKQHLKNVYGRLQHTPAENDE